MARVNGTVTFGPASLPPLKEPTGYRDCPTSNSVDAQVERLRLKAVDVSPAGFDSEAAQRLSDLELQDHFWMRERSRLVERLLARLRGPGRASWQEALELGCGTGRHLRLLEACAREVSAVDGHSSLLTEALAASSRTQLLQGDVCATELDSARFDLLMALDVIEHVNPHDLLREARRLALPGADFLLSAPAFPSLWSDMDVRAGHRCRYRRHELESELACHGWRAVGYTHFQFLLFPLVFASRRWPGRSVMAAERRPSARLDRWLGAINRLEVNLFNGLSLPFGSSVFVWAKAV